jgi:hypothetical protein
MGGADLLHNPCDPWKSLRATLDEIGTWAEQHPNEVLTIQFETKIHNDHDGLINSVVNASRIADRRFFPDSNNLDVPAPQGRAGVWRVDRYGWPTLRQLVQAGKNVVLFPNKPPRAAPGNPYVPGTTDSWKLEVQTVYGAACLFPNNNATHDWIRPRDESADLNNFTRLLCSVVHVPDVPLVYDGAGGINDLAWLAMKWQDIRTVYHRLPNVIWIDYYDRGYTGSSNPADPPAPAMFVNNLNSIWGAQPPVTALAQVTPAPTAYGWNNTDVHVALSGTGDTIQAITSRMYGATNTAASASTAYNISTQGVTTVTFSAVGSLGRRSPTKLVDVSIDKTLPTITGMLDRPPDAAGWYASNVTAHFECSDALSGVASCPADVVMSQEGANQSVTGTTIDRANNQSSTTITNINIDKTGPVITATANPNVLWPANNKMVNVVVTGQMTDAGSGVDSTNATYAVTDEYRLIQPNGKVTLGQNGKFSLTIKLEARRLGTDKDGREYQIRLNARDRVGHSSYITLPVTVPHDQGKK